VVLEFLETRAVARLPTAAFATATMLPAAMSAMCGVILDSVGRSRKETKRLAYLAARVPAAWHPPAERPAAERPADAGARQAASRGAAESVASRSSSTTGA
jgi:hypothetical protein